MAAEGAEIAELIGKTRCGDAHSEEMFFGSGLLREGRGSVCLPAASLAGLLRRLPSPNDFLIHANPNDALVQYPDGLLSAVLLDDGDVFEPQVAHGAQGFF